MANADDIDRLLEIKEEIRELLEEAISLVPRGLGGQAKSYWYAQMCMSLDNDHDWLGNVPETLQDTIDAMEEENEGEE